MQDFDRNAFQDTRNALLLVRILSRLQNERGSCKWLDNILRDEEKKSGYSKPVPLVNQAAFLFMLYATALWLRETYFSNKSAINILRQHVQPFLDKGLKIEYGAAAVKFTNENAENFARRIRNALGHASITVNEKFFIFKDVNPRNKNDWVEIEMPWCIVGQYTESLIVAGNHLLYPQSTGDNNPA